MNTFVCAISTGPSTHLDHLAPLCDMLKVPLIVTEPDHHEIARNFYPMIETQYIPLEALHLEFLSKWDAILTCGKFWAMELKPLLRMIKGSDVRFIFCPHGHSDKEKFLNKPVDQDIELVYGPRMKKSKKKCKAIEIGNLRHAFYLRYKEHFDALAAPFFRNKQTVLYAPSWASSSSPTSFFEHVDEVVSLLASSHHLLIKPHPLLEENDPALYHRAAGRYASQTTWIEDFPLVYPILEKTEIYLGDHSSIGYDFLTYDRPLFFLSEKGALMECGKKFTGSVNDRQKELSAKRRILLREVYKAPPLNEVELTNEIFIRMKTIPRIQPLQQRLLDPRH